MQRLPGREALSSEQRLAAQELRLRVAHHGWAGGGLGPLQVLLFRKSCKNDIVRLSPPVVPGQYYETCDGSSSSVTVNTTNIPLGAEVMEVMVYRKRERRKYSPLTEDNTVFYVTGRDI